MPPRVIIGLPDWNIGGPCIFAERLVRGLSLRGWDARVLLTETDTACVQERPTPGVRPNDIRIDTLPAGYSDSWGLRWDALVRYLEERAPCIYLMVSDWRNNVVAPRLSDRVALIGLVQADCEIEYNQALRLGHYWNAIVAVSDILQYTLAHRAPHLADRLVTIRNAVPDLAQMPAKSSDSPLRIVYTGELRHGQKRLGDLIQIAHGLEAAQVPFEMTLLGDGPFRAELEARAGSLIAQGRVRFPGRLSNARLLEELKQYDVFMLTSEFEGLSISLLEAMSRGCVPVVSHLATQSLVVQHGVNALAAPVGDCATFVSHLARLVREPETRSSMAQAAFRTIVEGGYRVEDMLNSYEALFQQIEEMSRLRRYVRHRGWIVPPPHAVGGVNIMPFDCGRDITFASEHTLWPNPPPPAPVEASPPAAAKPAPRSTPLRLEDHKVIVAIPSGQISGVDVFATHLVRRLRSEGIDAKIVGGGAGNDTLGLALADDVPIESPCLPPNATWPQRWDTMIDYLEAQGPCIYLPNYDYNHSGICPRLSDRVKVVNIAHSDDPMHYEHVIRLGGVSNAVVGVSEAITRHIVGLDPALAPRLHTIPYGIEAPSPPTERTDEAGRPLRILYAGRLVSYQKRVLDLIEIALELDRRGVPFELTIIGDGPEREEMQRLGRKLILKRSIWMPGKLNNAEVLELCRTSDVFLLPSTFEGLSVGLLEAMSCGLVPVVSAMRSGVPELIRHGENGLIVPTGQIPHFTEQLTCLQRNPDERRRLAEAAYRTILTGGYTLETMTARYRELFETILQQPFTRPVGPILPPAYLRGELAWKPQWRQRLRNFSNALTGRKKQNAR